MDNRECPHCRTDVPVLPELGRREMDRIFEVLDGGRRATAIFEAAGFLRCNDSAALQWLLHIESCPRWWRLTPACEALAILIDEAFASMPRPEHFTDPAHCAECREHDETLRQHSRESVPRAVFNTGLNPLWLCSAEGLLYYLPAIARYTFVPYSMGHGNLRELVSKVLGTAWRKAQIATLVNPKQQSVLDAYAAWLDAGID